MTYLILNVVDKNPFLPLSRRFAFCYKKEGEAGNIYRFPGRFFSAIELFGHHRNGVLQMGGGFLRV
jgi:hypothetical protein